MKNYKLRITNENTGENKQAPIKILVCDDDPAYRKLVRSYLRSAGTDFVLMEAGQKGEIQDALDTGGIDLILMDIQMPEKSGIEWLDEIVEKQIAPVVMLTGFGSEDMAVQSLHRGAVDYISKAHLTNEKLVDAIRLGLEVWKRKKAEEEIKERNKELGKMNRDLEEFIGMVSHDLRAPLRHIRTLSSFLIEDYGDKLDIGARDYMKKIIITIERAEGVIEGLLKLAKIRGAEAEAEEVDLNSMMKEIEEELMLFLKERKGRIEVEEKLPTLFGYRAWFKALFTNLITNGVKYNDREEKVVRVGFVDRGAEYEFYVADNGMGIEDKWKEELFKAFMSLDGDGGAGLGLPICKKIVDYYGGKIRVESEAGKGSTFLFIIPKGRIGK
jgi:signal transduction histidine kinase